MIKDNFSELDLLETVVVVEVKQQAASRSMQLRENDCLPASQAKVELAEANLPPSALLVDTDPDLSRVASGMVTGTLKAYALKRKMLAEFNHDPRARVVRCVPPVPRLLSWAQKVLWNLHARGPAQEHVVFGCHFSCGVQMVPYKTALCGNDSLGCDSTPVAKETASTATVECDVHRTAIYHDVLTLLVVVIGLLKLHLYILLWLHLVLIKLGLLVDWLRQRLLILWFGLAIAELLLLVYKRMKRLTVDLLFICNRLLKIWLWYRGH